MLPIRAISDHISGDTFTDYLPQLTIDHLICGDAAFIAVLSALIEPPVYFLCGYNNVAGILTRADLNTAPARIYLLSD